jgi:hypothetical protein
MVRRGSISVLIKVYMTLLRLATYLPRDTCRMRVYGVFSALVP